MPSTKNQRDWGLLNVLRVPNGSQELGMSSIRRENGAKALRGVGSSQVDKEGREEGDLPKIIK
jgi:hypothetical protein